MSSAQLFASIDCGATKSYTDENKIDWESDKPYINNGRSYTVKAPASVSESLKTLRAFTSRKKNCYSFAVQNGAPVLVRAGFYYHNYDGKASPPTFELQLDGNKWTTVETRMDEEVTYEIIYVVNDVGTSICVAQSMDGHIPFISAIQVSQLGMGMYANSFGSTASGLLLHRRVAFGSAKSIRYSDDEYDRIWEPSVSSDSLSPVRTNTTQSTLLVIDSPPSSALQTLVTPSELSTSLSIPLSTNLPSNSATVCFNLYFNDIINTDILTLRSFTVDMDGESITDPISLYSGQPYEYSSGSFTATGTNKFELKATVDSTLPPIISAMEVFVVTEELNNATHSSDLDGIGALMDKFDVLSYWGGDPCLPKSYNWDWVDCSSDNPPRITALHLGGFGLTGELPNFSLLTSLETIDMKNNNIIGGIPEFLGELPNLKELNLANNSFSGPVPSSVADNSNIKLVIDGNPNLCQSGQSCQTFSSDSPPNSPNESIDSPTGTTAKDNKKTKGKKKGANLGLILGLPIPLGVIALVAALVTYFLRTRKAPNSAASVGPGPGNQQNTQVNGQKNEQPNANNKPKDDKAENLEEVVVDVEEEVIEEI